MIRFEIPYYLYGLAALLPLALAFLWHNRWRMKKLKLLGELKLIERIIPNYSRQKFYLKFALVMLSITLVIIASANLQWGSSKRDVKREGLDIAIVLDVSNSMLASDVKPSRIMLAKSFASQFAARLPDSRFALVTFAGDPFLQMPLTADQASLQMMINSANAESAPSQGSDIGLAIETAINALPDNQNHYKVILLISDGEDHEGNIGSAVRKASDKGIMICTAGIGTDKGAFVPMVNAKSPTSFKRDKNGTPVTSMLNRETLQKIARDANGAYTELTTENKPALNKILTQLDGVKKNKYDRQLFVQYESRFQYFLLAALALLVWEVMLSNKKPVKRTAKKQTAKASRSVVVTACLLLCSAIAYAQSPPELIAKGNTAYTGKNYPLATQYYLQAIQKDAGRQYTEAVFNLGNTLYQQKKYGEAMEEYNKFIGLATNNELKNKAWFNLGNCYLSQKKYEQSMSAYKSALKLNPKDADARYNLAYVQALLNGQKKPEKKKEEKTPPPVKKPPQRPKDNQAEELEELLKSVNQSEQQTLDKVKKEKRMPTSRHEKDW